MHEDKLIQVEVDDLRSLTPSAFVLSLRWQPDFIAGQMIGLQTDPSRPLRLYSIASPPGDLTLEILYTLVEDGELTPHLSDLRSGDKLWVSPPRGEFIDRNMDSRAWWIANGSGVAPFLSMFRSGLRSGRSLIHGARTPEDFYGWQELACGDSDFRYMPCLSRRENAEYAASPLKELIVPGRLTEWLSGQLSAPDPPGEDRSTRKYYLCGSEQMIIQVRQMLISAGIPFEHIISEIYF